MAKDIEEFLKMAAARRRQAQTTGQAPAKPTAKPPQKKPAVVENVQVEVVSRSESVAEHVKSHIDTRRLQEHASRLGAEVGLADEKLEERLQSTFDHSVGTLKMQKARPKRSAKIKPVVDAVMLSSPATIRQAIIVSEILNRPEWD